MLFQLYNFFYFLENSPPHISGEDEKEDKPKKLLFFIS